MLSNLAAQQQPVKSIHELTMNDIQTFMAEQFDPKRFVVRERFKFWSDMKRKPGETIPELASRILQDAATCDFQSIKDPLDEALRTKFICSVDNEAVLKTLFKLKDDELKFSNAIRVAQRSGRSSQGSKGNRTRSTFYVDAEKVQNFQNARKENRLLQLWKFWTF